MNAAPKTDTDPPDTEPYVTRHELELVCNEVREEVRVVRSQADGAVREARRATREVDTLEDRIMKRLKDALTTQLKPVLDAIGKLETGVLEAIAASKDAKDTATNAEARASGTDEMTGQFATFTVETASIVTKERALELRRKQDELELEKKRKEDELTAAQQQREAELAEKEKRSEDIKAAARKVFAWLTAGGGIALVAAAIAKACG